MAGERCNKAFWDEVRDPSGAEGVVCRSGGKRQGIRGLRGSRERDINRDRTIVEEDGDVKRKLWDCSITTFDSDSETVTFKDCGYHTKLTKGRLNKLLSKFGKRIKQEDFGWYIDGDSWRSPKSFDLDDAIVRRL